MDARLSDPHRLRETWLFAAVPPPTTPDDARRIRINAELARRGLFRRMRAASAVASSRAFWAALEEARDERVACRNEDDLAALCRRLLEGLGADMADLQVRLRRATPKEVRASGARRSAAQIKMRITPTLDAARAAVAAVDQPGSEGLAEEISATDADPGSGSPAQAGQSISSG